MCVKDSSLHSPGDAGEGRPGRLCCAAGGFDRMCVLFCFA